MFVCVCERERERESGRESVRKREGGREGEGGWGEGRTSHKYLKTENERSDRYWLTFKLRIIARLISIEASL